MCLHLTASTSSACKLGQVSTQTQVPRHLCRVSRLYRRRMVSYQSLSLSLISSTNKKKIKIKNDFFALKRTAHVVRNSAPRPALYPAHVRHDTHFVRSGTGDGTIRA